MEFLSKFFFRIIPQVFIHYFVYVVFAYYVGGLLYLVGDNVWLVSTKCRSFWVRWGQAPYAEILNQVYFV